MNRSVVIVDPLSSGVELAPAFRRAAQVSKGWAEG